MPRAAANARARDGVSLLDAPDGWFSSASLRELKLAASRAGLERAWQDVRAAHRQDLADALLRVRDEWAAFVATVRASTVEDAVRRGVREIRRRVPGGSVSSDPARPAEALRDALERVASDTIRAAVHVVPGGSGVHLGEGLVLTCAHCVAADDDDDDDEDDDDEDDDGDEDEDSEDDGDDDSEDSRRRHVVDLTAEVDATPCREEKDDPSFASFRVGRVREVITARGDVRGAECVAADETRDLAILRLLDSIPAGLTATRVAPRGGDGVGVRVIAVGNPHDRDLEAPAGSAPRATGFAPFYVSVGEVVDVAKTPTRRGLGRLKHACWTYWGHSGCPIVDERGELVGVHTSWDDRDAARHGACLEDARGFLRDCFPRGFPRRFERARNERARNERARNERARTAKGQESATKTRSRPLDDPSRNLSDFKLGLPVIGG